jgi:hypothetical protein
MNLGDQLQELRDNVLRDTSDIIAGDTDSMWSDLTLLRYIRDAEHRFARQTLIIRDSTTPECTQVVLREGVTNYPLHTSILSVVSARYDTDSYDIQRSGHGMLFMPHVAEFLSWDPTQPNSIAPGRPAAYYTDETAVYTRQGKVVLSVYPTPGADQAGKRLYLRVVRLPMTKYSPDSRECESETPEGYQLDVLEWAAYRAQRGFDADAGSPVDAEKHKTAFEDAVKAAIREVKRTMFANTTIAYGANGFTWGR